MIRTRRFAARIRPSAKLPGGHPLLLAGVGLVQPKQILPEQTRTKLDIICGQDEQIFNLSIGLKPAG